MKYPLGVKRTAAKLEGRHSTSQISYDNRGMTLEEDIHITNQFYIDTNKAIIHKKPTPIQIVQVDYPKRSAAVIKEAYFQKKSTTDFNGIYQGKYIDFEAKETKNKTSFPLANIHAHQMDHLKKVEEHKGICFLIIRFTVYNETFLLPIKPVLAYQKKSMPYEYIMQQGYLIPFKYQARVDYLSIIDQLYF
jgi:recombination protein U